MKVEIYSVIFNDILGILQVRGVYEDVDNDDYINANKLVLRERREGIDNELFIIKKKYYSLSINNKTFSAFIDISKEKEFFCSSIIWDIYIYDDLRKKHYRCEATNLKELGNETFRIDEYGREIKPYLTMDGKLSVMSRKIINQVKCTNIDEQTFGTVYFDKNDLEFCKGDMVFRLKRRVNAYITSYDSSIDLPVTNYSVCLSKRAIEEIEIKYNSIFDAFLVLYPNKAYEQEYVISVNEKKSEFMLYNNTMKVKYYTTRANTLAYMFEGFSSCVISNIYVQNNELIFCGLTDFNSFSFESFNLISIKSKYYLNEERYIKSFKIISLENNFIKISISLDEISEDFGNSVYDLFQVNCGLKIKDSSKLEHLKLEITKELNNRVIEYNGICINILCGPKNTMQLQLTSKDRIAQSPINIAVLGSCYSRLPFSQNKYFNLNYKSKYNVVLTQYHSSLISIMNEKKRLFDERYFEILKPQLRNYVKSDFEKEFFDLIKQSKPDFLIIDLYADGERGVIRFKDGTIVTGSYDVGRSEFIYTLNNDDEIIHSKDISKFLPLWKDAAKRFSDKITKYISEERIIIHFINMTENYKTKNGEVREYSKNMNFIRRSNSLMDYMSSYLKGLLPKANYIDTRNTGYIGYEEHPQGNTPNHYESGYYKEFLNLLDDIVIKTYTK